MSGTSQAGPFRGRAIAVAVEDPAAAPSTTQYLVEDEHRPEPLWVDAAEIDHSASIPPGEPVIGYVTVRDPAGARAARGAASSIRHACELAGWRLVGIVTDRPGSRSRPGLRRALDQIAAGAARGLVVHDVHRVAGGEAALRALMIEVRGAGGHLVVVDGDDRPAGRRGRRAAAAERAAVVERITEMRAAGMPPQAIADALNQEGVAPLPGAGRFWHAWSVRAVGGAWPPRGPSAARQSAPRPPADPPPGT